MKIAIIGGAGKMGKWLASFLMGEGYDIIISDKDPQKLAEIQSQPGVCIAEGNVEAAKAADYVLLSVPIETFEAVVAEVGSHIQPGQVVMDVTSTKALPVELMHTYIKDGLTLGAHPLFGPGAKSVARQNFVLTPVTGEESALAEKVRDYLEARHARIAVMSPQEHDDMMSLVLGLSHFIAIVSADTLLSAGRLHPMETAGSSTYKVLLTLIESVLSEDPELYASIQMGLPRVAEYEKLLQDRVREWSDLVINKDRQEFAMRMKSLKDRLEEVSPDFVKAYENMYHIIEGL